MSRHGERRRPTAPGQSGPWILAIDTGTSRIVVAAGRADGSTIRSLAWPAGLPPRRAAPGRHRAAPPGDGPASGRTSPVSSSAPGPVPSPGFGWASRRRRRSPTRWDCRSPVSVRPRRSCAPRHRATRRPPARPDGPDRRVGGGGPPAGRATRSGPGPRGTAAPELLPGGVGSWSCQPRRGSSRSTSKDGRPRPRSSAGWRPASGSGPALIELGAKRLESGTGDDVERLVPEYVTLPRGVRASVGEIAWSHDRR